MGWFLDKYAQEAPPQDQNKVQAVLENIKEHPFRSVLQPLPQTLGGKSPKEVLVDKVKETILNEANQGRANWLANFAKSYLAGVAGDVADIATTPATYIPLPVGKVIGKIPVAGTTLGEIATKAPVGKGFMQSVEALGKNEVAPIVEQVGKQVVNALPESEFYPPTKYVAPNKEGANKFIEAIKNDRGFVNDVKATPDGIYTITWSQAKQIPKVPSIKTPQEFAENINLTKFPEDVRGKVAEIVGAKPEIGKTPTISDEKLFTMASEMKGTPTINYLSNLKEGTVEAEALKLRQGNTQMIRDALKQDLSGLKDNLDSLMEDGLSQQRKVASMFGRGLRQQKIPAETQQQMAFLIDDKIKAIKKDPIYSQDKGLVETMQKLKDTVVDKEFNPTVWNKAYNVWMNSILSSPMTHLVNTSSNALFALAKIPEKFASALWDLPLSTFTGKRTTYFGEIPAMIKGAFSKETLPQELLQGSKIEKFAQPIKGVAGKIINTPADLLQVEDNLAKNVIGRMEIYAQRYAGKTGEELLKSTQEEMLYRTFQNDPNVIANTLMKVRSNVPALRYVIPFVKTPANLIDRGLERTPLVLAKIMKKGIDKTYTQAELAKDLGLFSLGTTMAGWIAWQTTKGNITGNTPQSPAERDAFYRQGKKPNAVRVGDYWIPLDRLEPVGTAFSVIANLIQDYQKSNKELPPEKVLDSVGGLAQTLTNKTYLSGLTNFIKAISDPEMYGSGWLRRIASGVVPNALNFLAQIKDPYYRQANSVLDYMKSKIPFVSESLPAKLNALGEPVKRDILNIGRVNENPLERAIAQSPIGFPSKMLGNEKMTPEEYQKVIQESGALIKTELDKLANNPNFLSLPIPAKEKVIADIVSEARKKSRQKIIFERYSQQKQKERAFQQMTRESSKKPFGQSDFIKKYGK